MLAGADIRVDNLHLDGKLIVRVEVATNVLLYRLSLTHSVFLSLSLSRSLSLPLSLSLSVYIYMYVCVYVYI